MSNYKIGNLAEKYETGNKGVGFISNGSQWGDPGGDSYGPYQLETKKGTMQDYLKQNNQYTNELKQYNINSSAFKNKWKELAKKDPEGFQQSQFDFLCQKPGGYNDAYRWAVEKGWNPAQSFALQSAIYSTVNQSGGWKKGIFPQANIKPNDSEETKINKLYAARADYFRKITLKPSVKKAIILQRTDENMDGTYSKLNNERDDCLKLIGMLSKPAVVAQGSTILFDSIPTQGVEKKSVTEVLKSLLDIFRRK